MAVAASGSAFGSCSTTAIVEDEVVVTMTLPPFASTGDSFTIPVSVRNATGSDGVFSVGVSVSGALELTTSSSYQLALRNNEKLSCHSLQQPRLRPALQNQSQQQATGPRVALQSSCPFVQQSRS